MKAKEKRIYNKLVNFLIKKGEKKDGVFSIDLEDSTLCHNVKLGNIYEHFINVITTLENDQIYNEYNKVYFKSKDIIYCLFPELKKLEKKVFK